MGKISEKGVAEMIVRGANTNQKSTNTGQSTGLAPDNFQLR
jgi:hypothetical protein